MAITQSGSIVFADSISETNPALSFSLTVAAGSNRLLVVTYAGRSVSKSVSGITFDDVALEKAAGVSGNTMDAEVWYLIAPNVTTANVVVTLVAGGTFVYSAAAATVWNGVAQSSIVDDTDTNTTVANIISLSGLTTVTDACLVIDSIASNSFFPTMSAEANRTLLHDFSGDTNGLTQATSRILTKSPAGSVTMEWTLSGSTGVSLAGAAFKPASEAPAADKLVGSMLAMFQ